MFPTFDDFLSDMGTERMDEWGKAAVGTGLSVKFPITEENFEEFVSSMVAASHLVCCDMMRDYHRWLISKFDQAWLKEQS